MNLTVTMGAVEFLIGLCLLGAGAAFCLYVFRYRWRRLWRNIQSMHNGLAEKLENQFFTMIHQTGELHNLVGSLREFIESLDLPELHQSIAGLTREVRSIETRVAGLESTAAADRKRMEEAIQAGKMEVVETVKKQAEEQRHAVADTEKRLLQELSDRDGIIQRLLEESVQHKIALDGVRDSLGLVREKVIEQMRAVRDTVVECHNADDANLSSHTAELRSKYERILERNNVVTERIIELAGMLSRMEDRLHRVQHEMFLDYISRMAGKARDNGDLQPNVFHRFIDIVHDLRMDSRISQEALHNEDSQRS